MSDEELEEVISRLAAVALGQAQEAAEWSTVEPGDEEFDECVARALRCFELVDRLTRLTRG